MSKHLVLKVWRLALPAVSFCFAAGCGTGTTGPANPPVTPPVSLASNGRVMGGQQPVVGASLALWVVNTDGSAPSSLMNVPVLSDSSGNFSLTGAYSTTKCAANSQVYLIGLGGLAGATAPSGNDAIALMAALGPCANLSPSTFIQLNEVSTVTAVFSLAQFLGVTAGTSGAEGISVDASNPQSVQGMINGFTTANVLYNVPSGTVNPVVGNASVPMAKINTLGNAIASCVNTTAASSGACQALFSAVTPTGAVPPADTIQAVAYIAASPSWNVDAIYQLEAAASPFQPSLSSAPFDWTIAIVHTADGLNLPNRLVSDSKGNIWITSTATSGAEDLVALTSAGAPVAGSPFLSGTQNAFNRPGDIAFDTLGTAWISSMGTSAATGNRLVSYNPATGRASSFALPSGCAPQSLAIDAADDLFFACTGLGHVYELVNQSVGTPSPSNLPVYGGAPVALGSVGTKSASLALDQQRNLWASNTSVASGQPSVSIYSASNYAVAANTFPLSAPPAGLAADASSNVWVAAGSSLYRFTPQSGSIVSATFNGGGLTSGAGLAIAGAGDVWIANSAAASVGGTTYATLSHFSSAGWPLSPKTIPGVQPGGFAVPTTVAAPVLGGVTIDPSGDVWVAGCDASTSCSNGSFVVEYVGLAAPVPGPLASALSSGKLAGCCTFSPAARAGVTFSPKMLSPATVNAAYSQALTPGGGAAAYTFSVAGGSTLPSGLSLSASGVLSGTPAVSGVFYPVIQVKDHNGVSATLTTAITISNVTVTTGSVLAPVPATGYGIHTSVYDNKLVSDAIPGAAHYYPPLLEAVGINVLRYPGGNYADMYHFSNNSITPGQVSDTNACANVAGAYLNTGNGFGAWLKGPYANVPNSVGPTAFGIITANYGSNVSDANATVVTDTFTGSNAKTCSNPAATVPQGTPQGAAAEVAYANSSTTGSNLTIGSDGLYDWGASASWANFRALTSGSGGCTAKYSNAFGSTLNGLSTSLCIGSANPPNNYATQGFGVKYWEIGNEIYGNSYARGNWQTDLHYPYQAQGSSAGRTSQSALSPTSYGTNAVAFMNAMRAVDPTIALGTVADSPGSDFVTRSLAAVCGTNPSTPLDFISFHYYPGGGALWIAQYLSTPGTDLHGPNGKIAALNANLNAAGCKTSAGKTPAIFVTETGPNSSGGPWNGGTDPTTDTGWANLVAMGQFAADDFLSMFEAGAQNVDWLELHNGTFLSGDGLETPQGAYFGVLMAHNIAPVGANLISSANDGSVVVHATVLPSGKIGVLISNIGYTLNGSNPPTGTPKTVTINLGGDVPPLNKASAVVYTYKNNGTGNPSITTGQATVTNKFTVTLPGLGMVEYIITP